MHVRFRVPTNAIETNVSLAMWGMGLLPRRDMSNTTPSSIALVSRQRAKRQRFCWWRRML
eukprot:1003058-Prymnesium_polylepis.2